MNLHKIWLIAKREYLYNFRRRSFLFTAFLMPLISIGAVAIVIALVAQSMTDLSAYKHVGIVDQAGIFADAAGKSRIDLPAPFEIVGSNEAADVSLAARTLDGYYALPADFLTTGHVDIYNRPDLTFSEGLQSRFDDVLKMALAAKVGTASLADRVADPLGNMSLYRLGHSEPVDKLALVGTILVPMLLAMLIFTATTVTSQFLMSGLSDEKENRMMELFITSVRPVEILWGKILGLGALGLTQLVIWTAMGIGFASTRGNVNIGRLLDSLQLTPGYLLLLVAYFLLGYLVYSTMMFGIGASVNAEQESRQVSGLISLVSLLPIMLSFTYFIDPNGPVPVALSLFPLTAPVGMILRAAWTNVPPFQIALSVLLLVVSVVALIWLAARIFRLGLLNYGKRLGPGAILRALREHRRTPIIRPRPETSL